MSNLLLYGGIPLAALLISFLVAAIELYARARKAKTNEALTVVCLPAQQGGAGCRYVRLDTGKPAALTPCISNSDLGFEKLYAEYIIPTRIRCGDGDEKN